MKVCRDLLNTINSDESPIRYIKKYREFGILILDGGTSMMIIKYCPYCGEKLPEQLRDKWFGELEKLGILDPFNNKVPAEFHSDRWWKKRNL